MFGTTSWAKGPAPVLYCSLLYVLYSVLSPPPSARLFALFASASLTPFSIDFYATLSIIHTVSLTLCWKHISSSGLLDNNLKVTFSTSIHLSIMLHKVHARPSRYRYSVIPRPPITIVPLRIPIPVSTAFLSNPLITDPRRFIQRCCLPVLSLFFGVNSPYFSFSPSS